MREVWPTARITELCLQLTAGSRPVNRGEHRALGSQSCERAMSITCLFIYRTCKLYAYVAIKCLIYIACTLYYDVLWYVVHILYCDVLRCIMCTLWCMYCREYNVTDTWNGWLTQYNAGLVLSQQFAAVQLVLYFSTFLLAIYLCQFNVVVDTLVSVSKVNRRWAWLVLGWVTVIM